MSTPRPLLLLLGSGARIGTLTAQRFAQNGYNVAVVSRSGTNRRNENGFLSIKADLTDPKSIPRVFAAAKAEFGTGPSVVVYNVYSMAPLPEKDTLLSITVGSFVKDLNANTVSAFAAASEAVRVWNKMPESTARKAFIFTGNIQNVRHVPGASLATIGAGKAATAYWIGSAAAAYSGKGYKFFYADERNSDGNQVGGKVDGAAHADFYWDLAAGRAEVPWHATFVKGRGYVKF